jgi:hypothetical protein
VVSEHDGFCLCNILVDARSTKSMRMNAPKPYDIRRIAVIGAGPSGLATAKYVYLTSSQWSFVRPKILARLTRIMDG